MNTHERLLAAISQKADELIAEKDAIYKSADADGRRPNEDENAELQRIHRKLKTLQAEQQEAQEGLDTVKELQDLGKKLGGSVPDIRVTSEPADRLAKDVQKSLGELFVQSKGYQDLQKGGFSGQYTTGPMEFGLKAGTLLEGTSSPGSGQGGGFLPVPQDAPGVVQTLFQPPRVADLIPTGQATGNTVRYLVEGTATNAAAGVAEGGAKPASDLAVSTKDEPIKKIATVLTVSDEMLEDAAQVQSYINGRLALFVRLTEDVQLLRGAGTNDLAGILDSSRSINALTTTATADTYSQLLFKAMNGIRGSAFLEPSAIVINPTDYQTIRLAQDGQKQYYGGGPFMGPYGNGTMAQASGQLSGALDYLWGKPIIVTSAIGAGTALVGAFDTGAQIWRRSGITVEASNSHSTYFQNNLVMIRAEERLGLAVYRPTAFVKVTWGSATLG